MAGLYAQGFCHGGKRTKSKSADPGTWSVESAEKATEINHQQVSKWRKALRLVK